MSNPDYRWISITDTPFRIKIRHDGGLIAQCTECFTVSQGLGAIRHTSRYGTKKEVGEWINHHEHTDIRSHRDAIKYVRAEKARRE